MIFALCRVGPVTHYVFIIAKNGPTCIQKTVSRVLSVINTSRIVVFCQFNQLKYTQLKPIILKLVSPVRQVTRGSHRLAYRKVGPL